VNFRTVAGGVVGIVTFLSACYFIPNATCADGWNSPSIGRQGACSHHGGVRSYGELYLLALGGSLFAGLYVSGYSSNKHPSALPSSQNTWTDPKLGSDKKLIEQAISEKKRIEFRYKTPTARNYTKRTIRPAQIVTIHGRSYRRGTLCVKGFCELKMDTRTFALKRMIDLRMLGDTEDNA